MSGAVEAVAREAGEVDAADECDLVVDDHELLVMAVQRPLVRVERARDGSASAELVADPAYRTPGDRVERQGGASPQQHPYGHTVGGVGEQLAQDHRPLVRRQGKVRRDAPAGDVHVRACSRDRLGDPRERMFAVDQHLDRVAAVGCSPPRAQEASDAVSA